MNYLTKAGFFKTTNVSSEWPRRRSTALKFLMIVESMANVNVNGVGNDNFIQKFTMYSFKLIRSALSGDPDCGQRERERGRYLRRQLSLHSNFTWVFTETTFEHGLPSGLWWWPRRILLPRLAPKKLRTNISSSSSGRRATISPASKAKKLFNVVGNNNFPSFRFGYPDRLGCHWTHLA